MTLEHVSLSYQETICHPPVKNYPLHEICLRQRLPTTVSHTFSPPKKPPERFWSWQRFALSECSLASISSVQFVTLLKQKANMLYVIKQSIY